MLGIQEKSHILHDNPFLIYLPIARKIVDILDASLNYLKGKEGIQIDKDTSNRILEVSKFEETDCNDIFTVIDAFIAKRKIQSIL